MAETDQILKLAAIIREIDGNHSKGAAALAESILDHPDFRAALGEVDEPAVPEGREPASVALQPSDEELDDWHSRCADLTRLGEAEHYWAFDLQGEDVAAVARAAIARWGNPAPQPPAEPTVPTVMEIIELSYEIGAAGLGQVDLVRAALTRWGNPAPQPPSDDELLRLYGVATPCHTVHEWERELKFARAVLARWGNPAPQPPAEGEVEDLVNALKGIAYWRRHNKPGGPAPAPFDIRQADRLDRAADLLRRLSPPQPVPVSERLPGPEDCDAEGGCWWLVTGCNAWSFGKYLASVVTHWLPAHALPISQQQ